MPFPARSSAQRRRKKADEKLPERPGESTAASAQVMAPTRMKLRVRRRDGATATAAIGGGPLEEEEERRRESGSHSSGSRRKNSNKTSSSTAAASSSSSVPASSASASVRAVMAAEDASPDSKCPICLDRFNNLAYLDRCLHRFCFPCIQEWSHNKAECPLCKQPFASILHSVRAEDDFKEYTLRPAPTNSSVAATVAMVAAMASAARSDHQMRLMLRRHRVADGGETLTRRRRRERTGRGEGGRNAEDLSGMWEWYLDSPPLPPLPHHTAVSPVVTEDSDEEEDLELRRASGGVDPSERGVIFETGFDVRPAPVAPSDRTSRRLMARLVARQRQQREGGAVGRLRERETVAFRRSLYRCGVRVRGVAGVNANPGQQQCDITAESFCRNPALLNRLRPWLRRELTVLYGSHSSLVDMVQRIIMARLTRHGLQDAIQGELRQFLLARTEHFVHELVNFARSPLSMENYDQQAVYEPPAAALELDGVSSSSSDSSSVIAISEGEEEEQRRAGGRVEERAGGGGGDDVIQTGSCLSLSGWDDETPGPSYSTAEQSCPLASLSFSPAPQQAANEERGEKQEGEEAEECLIVGYKKPIAERTPELVQLSSDTEEEKTTEKVSPLPSTAAAHSLLPTIPPSTSGSFREEQEDKQKEEVNNDRQQHSRPRSWSGSSGRSKGSVCMLSPSTPGEWLERGSQRNGKRSMSEAACERRRRKRRRRERERSGDRLRKSGTLYNPNRSIYPAMMLRHSHSSSPFHSTSESGSPEPPSPADSSWEYHCAQVSPLTSSISVSSPSHSSSSSSRLSSSPLPSSPLLQTPPTPSLSPSGQAHHGEKPGGKRKYKSRHLDSDKDPTWRPSSGNKDKRRERRRRGRDGRRRRERRRRDSHRDASSYGGESSRKSREDRSPSVEIIYEGTITTTQPPTHKRRRRRHRRTLRSSSPVIITLDSDNDDNNNKNSNSSSPLSSQQTVDFSDLPPLPLVHSAGMGGALEAEIGELPVDILDRESDGSGTEPEGPSAAVDPIAVDNSDAEVDVEHDDAPPSDIHRPSQPMGWSDAVQVSTEQSDSALLAAILDDLRGICPPKPDLSLNHEDSRDGCSAETRHASSAPPDVQPARRASIRPPPPPPLERYQECYDVPPLHKQVQSHRDTPPPLKHRDAGSPRQILIAPSAASPSPLIGLLNSSEATPPADVRSDHATHVDYNHATASELHSSTADLPPASAAAPAVPHSVDRPRLASAGLDQSTDRTVHADSPSGGCKKKTACAARGGAFSGVESNHVSSPICLSSIDSRTEAPSSPTLSPSGIHTVPPTAPVSGSSPAQLLLHPASPRTVDLRLSGAAAEEPTGRRTLSAPSHDARASIDPPPPSSVSPLTDGRLNHTALSSSPSEHTLSSHTSHTKSKPSTEPHSRRPQPTLLHLPPQPKRSERDLRLHTDNHMTSLPETPIDSRSQCQLPAGERSHSWNTNTHSGL